MNDDEFLRYVPRCDKCGEIFPPGRGPSDYTELRFREADGTVGAALAYHAKCAPSLCTVGCVTILDASTCRLSEEGQALYLRARRGPQL